MKLEEISGSYNTDVKLEARFLFLLLIAMVIMSAASNYLVAPILSLFVRDDMHLYLMTLLVSAWLIFYLPAWLINFYYERSTLTYFFRLRYRDIQAKKLWIIPLIYLLYSPAVEMLTLAMEQIPIPEALKAFELNEVAAMEKLEAVTRDTRPISIILAVLGLAVVTPLSEEVFFRGALQGWLLSNLRNKHLVVWLVGLIFSLLHMEWSGMLARWFMGAILGYIALYGGLWMAVLLHMLNNLIVLCLMYLTGDTEWMLGDTGGSVVLAAILSGIGIVGIYFLLRRLRHKR